MDLTNKSSTHITFIDGSTTAGHPLPLHFQLKSVATDKNKCIQTKYFDGLLFVYGVYGGNKLIKSGPTVNCNASAGMNATEFWKFILDAIVPLYPNTAEKDGKCVLLILDSGPLRKDEKLLSFLAARGFHLLPGVPNTTHVTQPTNQNYGYCKLLYRSNLDELVDFCCSKNASVWQTDIPLLVLGKQEW